MGAMCGKSQHFEGEGHQLNKLTNLTNKSETQTQSTQPKPTNFPTKPNSTNPELREKLAKAAEIRIMRNQKRGGNGKLSKSLDSQKSNDNRIKEAIEIGSNKKNNLNPTLVVKLIFFFNWVYEGS